MNKTLEELRAETDQYLKNIIELGGKIKYQIETIKTAIRGSYMTEEQLIEREKVSGFGVSKDSTIL